MYSLSISPLLICALARTIIDIWLAIDIAYTLLTDETTGSVIVASYRLFKSSTKETLQVAFILSNSLITTLYVFSPIIFVGSSASITSLIDLSTAMGFLLAAPIVSVSHVSPTGETNCLTVARCPSAISIATSRIPLMASLEVEPISFRAVSANSRAICASLFLPPRCAKTKVIRCSVNAVMFY